MTLGSTRPGLVRRGARKLLPQRTVRAEVQGVTLAMPWHHRLPDYSRAFPAYGQNLVKLARLLSVGGSLQMVDVGANIGDSTLQVAAVSDLRSLCVEGDPYWLRYLETNLAGDGRYTIEAALIVADAAEAARAMAPVRHLGTTRFESSDTHRGLPRVPVSELPGRHPDFDHVRLVKSDTDGYDVGLVPSLARAWQSSLPVLFFEYDPALTRKAGESDPARVWAELSDLGYVSTVIWDNFGGFGGHMTVDDASALSHSIDQAEPDPSCLYWDVAVVHAHDSDGLAALTRIAREDAAAK